MSGHTRLMRRKATYYHRAKVPIDILDSYGKSEETFSLKTKDYQEALKRVKIAAVEIDEKFAAHRRATNRPVLDELSDLQLEQLKQACIRCLLEENDQSRSHSYEQSIKETKFIDNNISPEDLPKFNQEVLSVGFKTYIDESIETTKAELADLSKKYARGITDASDLMVLDEMLELEAISVKLAPNSPSLNPAMVILQEAQIEAYKIILGRFDGVYSPTEEHSQPLAKSSTTTALPTSSGAPKINKVANAWIAEKSRSEWKPKTKNEHEIWITHFISFTKDKPIDSYSKEDGRAFKAMLLSLPSNWKKKKDKP